MKLVKMQKMYCPECKNRIKCELTKESEIKKDIKWFGTGSMDSESKLWPLRHRITSKDFCCAVMAEIIKVRFRIKVENLFRQIERLEADRKGLLIKIEKCDSIIPKKEEVMMSA